MRRKDHFDFWYAVNNTEVVRLPPQRLETFGATVVNYHLVTELMDMANKVRVREGRIQAYRPEIITPRAILESVLDGFGEEAGRYAEWLRANEKELLILKYGFKIRKQETREHVVSEALGAVIEAVKAEMDREDDPLSALVVGVDDPWEVCLLKLMVEVVQQSAGDNLRDLRRDPSGIRHRIEQEFRAAAGDSTLIPRLSRLLEKHDLFEEYQDRFFALVRSSRGR